VRSRSLILLCLLAVLVPTGASAADVRFAAREEPLRLERAPAGLPRVLPPRRAPFTFNLVGLHWRGDGTVWFRTRSSGNPWSSWSEAMSEGEDLPDKATREAARGEGWKLGNPWWTGGARLIQYRVEGVVRRLRAHFVWSPPSSGRRLAIAGTPSIISRAGWGANESIVRARPRYAARIRLAIVHHTAGRNGYGPDQSAAIVRAIQVYHVKANGWNDIGYNLLVDKYGQVFEGRVGGVDRNVVGAHARGFNSSSVGIALLGSYGNEAVSPEAEAALEAVLAWRLDVAHVDPLATATVVTSGNEKFAAGASVALRAVSGHRDTGSTSCPGNMLYARLSSLAQRVAGLGLPKLYDPTALPSRLVRLSDGMYRPILFTARLSGSLPWTVTVAERTTGAVVASSSGSGALVSWTWDGNGPDAQPVDPAGTYVATLAAGDGVRPASLTLFVASPLDVTDLTVVPQTLTATADDSDPAARISFRLSTPARVRVRLEDEQGARVATIVAERRFPSGPAEVTWGARGPSGESVPDGGYQIVVVARRGKQTVSRRVPIVVDTTVAAAGEPEQLANVTART
jgi:N-acetylmuramoyl-L-alanine amidase/FlgD Ig-like domain